MKGVEIWLATKGIYQDGIDLLEACQPDHPLLPLFKSQETKWSYDKITQILRTLKDKEAPKPKHKPKTQPKKKKAAHSSGASMAIDTRDLPAPMQREFKDRIKRMYIHMRALRSEFSEEKGKEHNKKVSDELNRVIQGISSFYDRAREYQETGKVIVVNKGLFQQYKDLERRMNSTQKYISERRSRPEMRDAVEERAKELEEIRVELAELEEHLLQYV